MLMEARHEQRIAALEERMERLEQLLRVSMQAPPAPTSIQPLPPAQRPPVPPLPPQAPRPARPPRELNLEDLLGGRLLAWLGGAAVVLGVVFFLVMAVSRGWIDEPTRVVLAFLGSTALLGLALWLHERHGQTQASLAAAAAAIASLYASLTVGTLVYDLIPAAAGFAVAGLVGAVATAIAVRWSSRVVAGIGIVGALLAPVLVGAGTSSAALAFMTIALVAAVAVLLWQRWNWLAGLAFLVSVPQLLAWVNENRGAHLTLSLGVLLAFWAVYVVAAIGYELRVPTEKLRASSALLLFANVLTVAGSGYVILSDQGEKAGATVWVLALAAGHIVLGVGTMRGRISREVGALIVAIGVALSAVGFGLALSGPALVVGWAVHAALLAWLARRAGDERAAVGAAGFVALALGHVLLFEAPPKALAYGVHDLPNALVGIGAVAAACLACAWLRAGDRYGARELFYGLAATLGLYLCSVTIVDLAGGHQRGQLLLSAFWGLTGLAALVLGLAREARALRLGGFALLGVAVVKVFLVDLATLESIYRVASFVALGLVLLAGAFAYQRVQAAVEGGKPE
jgi:uncharacterized membrane protein